MLFNPTLPVKVEFTAMPRMLSNAKNDKWRLDYYSLKDKKMTVPSPE